MKAALQGKVGGLQSNHLPTISQFWGVQLLETYFSKLYLKDKLNWYLTQVVSYFLNLHGTSDEF